MRLLDTRSLELEEFFDEDIPPYAILSHTWLKRGEVMFQDMRDPAREGKPGFAKIKSCCAQAWEDGHRWVWIDTCCIDKTSSAELSEAINSMYRWYAEAEVCYAYLSDVDAAEEPWPYHSTFRKSRWFKRGWTLQELLAPKKLQFFGSSWDRLRADKYPVRRIDENELLKLVSGITGIRWGVLAHLTKMCDISVAERISWAAGRLTSRREDRAYSLLGILDINMPLLYGEGDKAFTRLQEEVIRKSYDHSLFAWGLSGQSEITSNWSSLLAPSPDAFRGPRWPIKEPLTFNSGHYLITNLGLHITMPIIRIGRVLLNDYALGILNWTRSYDKVVVIPLRLLNSENICVRAEGCSPFELSSSFENALNPSIATIYLSLQSTTNVSGYLDSTPSSFIHCHELHNSGFRLVDYFCSTSVSIAASSFSIPQVTDALFKVVGMDNSMLLIWHQKKNEHLPQQPRCLQLALTDSHKTALQLLLTYVGPTNSSNVPTPTINFDNLQRLFEWFPGPSLERYPSFEELKLVNHARFTTQDIAEINRRIHFPEEDAEGGVP
ncbi:HET-domain-containing protein [Hypoxylon sp. FL1150]|nr:HET-domain-containing protein [Hypoxylon sp. FL1150]